jgi:general secretion pathway protein B
MSLILDALKKSEAERNRGIPPRLHTPHAVARRERGRWMVPGVAAVVFAAGGGATWMILNPKSSANATVEVASVQAVETAPIAADTAIAAQETTPAVATATSHPVAAIGGASASGGSGGAGLAVPQRADLYTPSQDVAPQTVQAAAPPATVSPPAAEQVKQPIPEATPAPAPAPPAVAVSSTQPVDPAPATELKDQQPLSAPIVAEAATAPAESLLLVYQLPYSIRKELPKLDLSMHVFAPDREERFVVLNGKRYQLDGAQPGPEVNLLDISELGAVLEFRGQKFLLPRQEF